MEGEFDLDKHGRHSPAAATYNKIEGKCEWEFSVLSNPCRSSPEFGEERKNVERS